MSKVFPVLLKPLEPLQRRHEGVDHRPGAPIAELDRAPVFVETGLHDAFQEILLHHPQCVEHRDDGREQEQQLGHLADRLPAGIEEPTNQHVIAIAGETWGYNNIE